MDQQFFIKISGHSKRLFTQIAVRTESRESRTELPGGRTEFGESHRNRPKSHRIEGKSHRIVRRSHRIWGVAPKQAKVAPNLGKVAPNRSELAPKRQNIAPNQAEAAPKLNLKLDPAESTRLKNFSIQIFLHCIALFYFCRFYLQSGAAAWHHSFSIKDFLVNKERRSF
ncbi:hypothetical protein [Sporolactobacillus sp. KGMB 08714]|uniref:hypothetical protein n=1 Tax=Sporolactobacillus sp. KGMB 08714 TaxID=3064704 RepID=UPI002FBD3C1B